MASRIFPSQNDVHDTSGQGRKPTEANLNSLRSGGNKQLSHYRDGDQISDGGVLSGFDFSSGDATSVVLTAGTAMIQGYNCEETTTISGVLTASTFNFVFLTVDRTASLATDLSLTVVTAASFNVSITPPTDPSILLWCFETDGASIITQFDFRQVGSGVMYGSYLGDDAATRTINLGFRPKLVQIHRNENGNFIAQSPFAVPRVSGQQRGLFMGEVATGAAMTAQLTNDPELVPILTEDGFSLEDGPGSLPGPTYIEASKTFQPPGPPAGDILGDSTASTTVTVTGAAVGDLVTAIHDGVDTKNIVINAEVTSANTVTCVLLNTKGTTTNVPSGTLKAGVFATGLAIHKLNELNQLYYFVAWF